MYINSINNSHNLNMTRFSSAPARQLPKLCTAEQLGQIEFQRKPKSHEQLVLETTQLVNRFENASDNCQSKGGEWKSGGMLSRAKDKLAALNK